MYVTIHIKDILGTHCAQYRKILNHPEPFVNYKFPFEIPSQSRSVCHKPSSGNDPGLSDLQTLKRPGCV